MHRSTGSRSGRVRALSILAGAVLISACAGENLFSAFATAGGSKPTVDITAPTEGQEATLGAAVQVAADIVAQNGLNTVELRGSYAESGGAAYVGQTLTFQNVAAASVSEVLNAIAGQVIGNVYIVVTATDIQGESASDSVKVVIN